MKFNPVTKIVNNCGFENFTEEPRRRHRDHRVLIPPLGGRWQILCDLRETKYLSVNLLLT
jgi:hypothetical protein